MKTKAKKQKLRGFGPTEMTLRATSPDPSPFCHVQKQPTILHQFSDFKTYFLLQLLCFAESTIKPMFSEEHSFSKTQLVKPLFHPSPKTRFSEKGVTFGLGQFPLKPLCFCFPGFDCFGPKMFLLQILCTKMRFSSFPDANSVRQFLLNIFHFFGTTTLKTQFLQVSWAVCFFHFVFVCFSCSNKQKTKNKNASFYSKTSLLTSRQFCENTIWAQIVTICVF